MKRQNAATGYGRSDVNKWRQVEQEKDGNPLKKEGKKEDTTPKAIGLCTIVLKDKDLLMSCIDEGKLKLANGISVPYIVSTAIAYLCVIDSKHFLNDPNSNMNAIMSSVMIP